MLANKNPASLLVPMADTIISVTSVPVPGHEYHGSDAFGATIKRFIDTKNDVSEALAGLPDDGQPVLIAGSLYLAGEVLRLNGQFPT